MGLKNTFDGIKKFLNEKRPEISLAIGFASGGAAIVTACIKSRKLDDKLTKLNSDLDIVNKRLNCKDERLEEFTNKEAREMKLALYLRFAKDMFKLYSVPIALSVISAVSFVDSYKTNNRRTKAVVAALNGVVQSFNEYRDRAKERVGEDVEKEIFHNVKKEVITETQVNEDGKKEKVKRDILTPAGKNQNRYTYRFDAETWDGVYTGDANVDSYNIHKTMWELEQSIRIMKPLVKKNYVTLSDVFDKFNLQVEKTTETQLVGWVYDPNHREYKDNVIRYDICIKTEKSDAYKNGLKEVVYVSFDVDGAVF